MTSKKMKGVPEKKSPRVRVKKCEGFVRVEFPDLDGIRLVVFDNFISVYFETEKRTASISNVWLNGETDIDIIPHSGRGIVLDATAPTSGPKAVKLKRVILHSRAYTTPEKNYQISRKCREVKSVKNEQEVIEKIVRGKYKTLPY